MFRILALTMGSESFMLRVLQLRNKEYLVQK